MPGILGYSSTPYEEETYNPGFQWWKRTITAAVEDIVRKGKPVKSVIPDPGIHLEEVPQLMSNVWGQMEPFNNLCPMEYDANGNVKGRCVVGCVATSATQVMHYYQYPGQGTGIHIDMQTVDAFGNPRPLKVDLADYEYDYSKMRDSMSPGTYTEEEAEAVSKLAYSVGVTFGMIYSTGASGTYSDSAVVALREHFNFPEATLMDRMGCDENKWMDIIFRELGKGHPILYSGADPWGTVGGGGHAFVFDGYDCNGLVHVNWGWYGRNDGYYEVSLLNPRIHSFVNQQDMIVGVVPPGYDNLGNKNIKLTGKVGYKELRDAVLQSKAGRANVLDLTEADINGGSLPDKAFYGSNFQKIILPANTVRFGNGVFGQCRSLMEVVFPAPSFSQDFIVENDMIYSRNKKKVISVLPWYHNNDLVTTDFNSMLAFPEGISEIAPHAADGCFRVKGIEIPSSVKYIGEYAFANTSNAKVFLVKGVNPARAAARAFSGIDPVFTRLYLPAGTSDTYCRNGEWNKFFAFDNVYEFGTNVVACNAVRNQGEKNPEFTYRMFGEYVSGEPELSCEATAESEPGEYPIKVRLGSLSGDNILLTDGVLRVLENTVSVESVLASPEGCHDVYSVDGRMVGAGIDSFGRLEKGVYIVNGEKILVK